VRIAWKKDSAKENCKFEIKNKQAIKGTLDSTSFQISLFQQQVNHPDGIPDD
jgi:hypothetical protein